MDNSVRDGSPHQMAGDVVVLASTSTHVADMTSSLNGDERYFWSYIVCCNSFLTYFGFFS